MDILISDVDGSGWLRDASPAVRRAGWATARGRLSAIIDQTAPRSMPIITLTADDGSVLRRSRFLIAFAVPEYGYLKYLLGLRCCRGLSHNAPQTFGIG